MVLRVVIKEANLKPLGLPLVLLLYLMTSTILPASLVQGAIIAKNVARVVDAKYPGTAVTRMMNARNRAQSLDLNQLSGPWNETRVKILWAAGLKDLQNVPPGQGYTGHSFNDWNHVDATCMLGDLVHEENGGRVSGIAQKNRLGDGILRASLDELGEGGSWSTCSMGCHLNPPQDVAHIQFQSRIAFKLVWCPPLFSQFVLVDDDGELLAWGEPTGTLPDIRERQANFEHLRGSKYSKNAFMRESICTETDHNITQLNR